MSVAMMCSTQTMVTPSSPRIRLSNSAAVAISVGSRPPRLSSASKSRGPVARARASSSFLSPAAPSSAVEARPSAGKPTVTRISRARRRASAASARRAAPKWAATATFSRIESLRNGRGIWNVLAIPRWQIASGVRPAISSPRNRMEPAVHGSAPEMQLKAVVFPEPFGPMSPRISPSLTSKETAVSAAKPPKCFVSPLTASIRGAAPPPRSAKRKRRGRRERQDRLGGRHGLWIDQLELPLDDLEDGGERALVLAGEPVSRRVELHAVALHRAAVGDVGLAGRGGQRVGAEAAVLLDGARQHVGQQDVQVVEAHRDVRCDRGRGSVGVVLRLVPLHHLGGEVADAGLEFLRVQELGSDRVERVEELHVLAEGLLQLVELAVAGAVADVGPEAEPLLLGLAEEERDVGVVAGVVEDVGSRGAELRDERREVGRVDRIAFLQHDVEPELLRLQLVAERDVGAVRAVLVDDRQPEVLGGLLEPVLRVVGGVLHRELSELRAGRLMYERVP